MTQRDNGNGNPYAYFGGGNLISYASALPSSPARNEEDELRQRVIEESYAGNAAAYEADSAERLKYALSWQDLAESVAVLPDLDAAVRELVFRRLGYQPDDTVLLRHGPFLRALLHNQRSGLLAEVDFSEQADAQIKLLRNEDLQQGDWVASLELSAEDLARYENEMPAYKQLARDRVTRFLGYEPELRYSLEAEIRLRRLLTYDAFHLDETITELDVKILTIILYRELYVEAGPAEADAMPLLGGKPALVASTASR